MALSYRPKCWWHRSAPSRSSLDSASSGLTSRLPLGWTSTGGMPRSQDVPGTAVWLSSSAYDSWPRAALEGRNSTQLSLNRAQPATNWVYERSGRAICWSRCLMRTRRLTSCAITRTAWGGSPRQTSATCTGTTTTAWSVRTVPPCCCQARLRRSMAQRTAWCAGCTAAQKGTHAGPNSNCSALFTRLKPAGRRLAMQEGSASSHARVAALAEERVAGLYRAGQRRGRSGSHCCAEICSPAAQRSIDGVSGASTHAG